MIKSDDYESQLRLRTSTTSTKLDSEQVKSFSEESRRRISIPGAGVVYIFVTVNGMNRCGDETKFDV
ncbi:MAG: hypothetical protein HY706_18005 [Candidatus Hydrogenedentes bacterium]|nr:hypothetical protein [Candidatus Hydrogenedentota bacterium]